MINIVTAYSAQMCVHPEAGASDPDYISVRNAKRPGISRPL